MDLLSQLPSTPRASLSLLAPGRFSLSLLTGSAIVAELCCLGDSLELSQHDSAAPLRRAHPRRAGWGQSLSLEICSTVTLGRRKVLAAGQAVGRQRSNQQMHGKTASLKKSTEKLGGVQRAQDTSLYWPEGLKGEDVKKCRQEGMLLSKYNQQYHKLFKDIPLEEVVLKVCSCALQRDLLLQGRLYISPNWLCFHASLFGKDIKVVIPVVSVQMIKKHKMARLLPNGLAITTNTSQKYVFVSLLSRDSVYDMLRRVCTHLQPSSKKSLCVREFPEEPECESLEALIPEMKWRKVCPASRSVSLPDSIPCISRASMESTDSFFPSREPLGSEISDCEEEKLEEGPTSNQELKLWDYPLLKVFFVLICFLVMSSSYLAFRISQLEQQLCSLNWGSSVPGHR